MGTSKRYGGPPSGLTPSWIDDVAPGASVPSSSSGTHGGAASPPTATPVRPPASANLASAPSLSAARGNFTRFVRSGDGAALRRAVSQYVRKGTGGAGGAAQRMGTSRVVGSQLLGLIREFQREGAPAALQQFNLTTLAGRPATDVFIALTEVICPPGGRVDEAIARQAMLDTIADMAEQGASEFDELTPEQLKEFFLGFVVHTIEERVIADLGRRTIELPSSVAEVEAIQEQLHDFVDGSVRAHVGEMLDTAQEMARDDPMDGLVERIYEACFELVAAAVGDVE